MDTEVAEIFAKRVQARLDELNESTDWLGSQLGIHGSGVRTVLNQKRAVRIDTAFHWAEKLGVSPAWLLGIEAPPKMRDPSPEELALLLIEKLGVNGIRLEIIEKILKNEFTIDGWNHLKSTVDTLSSVSVEKKDN